MIKINVSSIRLFPYIKDKATMDTNLTHGDEMPPDWLSKTVWKDFEDPIIGILIPHFLITILGKFYPMAISAMMRSWQNLFV